jgi:hypothetical protein
VRNALTRLSGATAFVSRLPRGLAQFLFATLAVGALLIKQAHVAPMAGIEENFINWLAANSDSEHRKAPVTLIEINDNCLVNYPWPWTPLNYALFLDAAQEFGARVAAVEPVMAWDETKLTPEQQMQLPQFEKILHESILKSPRLEMGAELGYPEDPDVLPPLQPMPVFRNVSGDVEAVPEYTIVENEPGEDIRLTASLGFTNIPATEAAAHHAPLVFRYRGQMVPAFPLEAMMLWYGVTTDEVTVKLGSYIRLGDKLTIPINQTGSMLVDWKQPCDRVGFDDLILAEDQLQGKRTSVIDPALLKDRLLIVARADAQSQTLLFPMGRMGSAGELFAEAIATAESNAFARPAGMGGKLLVLAIGLALAWATASQRVLKAIPLLAACGASYLLLCLAVFEATRMALPLTPMLGTILFVTVFRVLAPRGRREKGTG